MTRFHVNNDGETKRCRAQSEDRCKFTIHGDSMQEAQSRYEESMDNEEFDTFGKKDIRKVLKNSRSSGTVENFSNDSFYGDLPPREVQLEALNGVMKELEEADQTQLIAACGTGKTYMGRQLLNHEMEKPGSNGIAVILTSNIKLAEDTADDMRPTGGYDRSFGEFGEDYEVIEVHSNARLKEGRSPVLTKGRVDVDKIQQQIADAKSKGKKVVIVSTYDSCDKVQEAQSRFTDGSAEADILMHDEAHNILGQQTPTGSVSEESLRSAYTGFDNSIPGAIQSKKRLYATATPVIRETGSDKESTASLEEAINTASTMSKDRKARVTFYSDDPIVGRISGYISQNDAIDSGCLSKPDYSIRENSVDGDVSNFRDPVVDSSGQLQERMSKRDMSPETYASISSTLEAMSSDNGDENGTHNALAYTGSIEQSEAFVENFKKVAYHKSGGMKLEEAETKINDENEDVRRKARMRLLAQNVEVRSAHSGSSIPDKKKAFEMFKGKSPSAEDEKKGWTPNRRVLANVDIFSEGVSIPEIDTVVMTDDDKFSERAMTQAVGRSLRKVSNNPHKTTGHVIIPEVKDSAGHTVNGASVSAAAYGASRVERGVNTAKVRGENVTPDETTAFKRFDNSGKLKEIQKARGITQNSVKNVDHLIIAGEVERAHNKLVNEDKDGTGYRSFGPKQRAVMLKTNILDRSTDKRAGEDNREISAKVYDAIKNSSSHELTNLRRERKTLSRAMSAGDVSSINDEVSSNLISANILIPRSGKRTADVTNEEKTSMIEKHSSTLAHAILMNNKAGEENPPEIERMRKSFPDVFEDKRKLNTYRKDFNVRRQRNATARNGATAPGTAATEDFETRFKEKIKNDSEFREDAYKIFRNGKSTPFLEGVLKNDEEFSKDRESHNKLALERERDAASIGTIEYTFNPKAVRSNGDIRSDALKKLSKISEWRIVA